MAISYFGDKEKQPEKSELPDILGTTFSLWEKTDEQLLSLCPELTGYWKFPTKKAGWTWIDAQKKSVMLYRQPCENHFRATIVLGEASVNAVLDSSELSDTLKTKIEETTAYAEGRSILIEIHTEKDLDELLYLLPYKLK